MTTIPAARRIATVARAIQILPEEETEKLVDHDKVLERALERTEESGIIFIDEIDKICTPSNYRHGSDASSEGVQRDLLPIIEGSVVRHSLSSR